MIQTQTSTSQSRLLPLADAAAHFGVGDLNKFRTSAKRIGAVISVAGIDFVDTDRIMEAVMAKSERSVELKAARAGRPRATQRPGQQIGLIQARLKKSPTLIANKERKIREGRQKIEAARTPYDRRKAERELVTLETGLANIRRQKEEDTAALEAILNETPAA